MLAVICGARERDSDDAEKRGQAKVRKVICRRSDRSNHSARRPVTDSRREMRFLLCKRGDLYLYPGNNIKYTTKY